jgi:hypothetical protein
VVPDHRSHSLPANGKDGWIGAKRLRAFHRLGWSSSGWQVVSHASRREAQMAGARGDTPPVHRHPRTVRSRRARVRNVACPGRLGQSEGAPSPKPRAIPAHDTHCRGNMRMPNKDEV